MTTDQVTGEPILIPCEGAGFPPAAGDALAWFGICRMCGQSIELWNGIVTAHDRDDVLARIDRGDFG